MALLGIALEFANADVIHLRSGSTVDGNIVKRSDKRVWVDIGSEVLSFDMEDVASIDAAAAAAPLKVERGANASKTRARNIHGAQTAKAKTDRANAVAINLRMMLQRV